ncbi:MAG: 50S ribosomal protein L25 [Lentisphaeria bacterium]|nr:50S ribosomal protein L25 [Lentisphaeria bacterium]
MAKVKHVLNVQARTAGGTGDARRLRKTGLIPAIVYGKGLEPKSISVDATEWQLLSRNELNILSLVEDGKETLVLLKEVQHDPIRNRTRHLDFQAIRMDQKIKAHVAVRPGHALPAGASAGGLLEQNLHEIEVESLPQDLPEEIIVDVSGMNLGDMIHVGDIPMPEGVVAVTHAEIVVFTEVDENAAAAEEEEAAPAEGEEAAEPEVIAEKKTEERAAARDERKKGE